MPVETCRYTVKMGVTKDRRSLFTIGVSSFGRQNILLFPAETYEPLKRLFDEINKADNHTITLKQTALLVLREQWSRKQEQEAGQ